VNTWIPRIPVPIYPVMSVAAEAPLLRIPLKAGDATGLQAPPWAASDLVQRIGQRHRRSGRIGSVARETMLAIDERSGFSSV
jgi:hypothetical protein